MIRRGALPCLKHMDGTGFGNETHEISGSENALDPLLAPADVIDGRHCG